MRKDTKDTADLEEPIEVDDLEVPDADEADLEDLADADLLEDDDDEELGEVALVDDLDDDDDEVVVGAGGVVVEVEIVPIETEDEDDDDLDDDDIEASLDVILKERLVVVDDEEDEEEEAPDSEERGEGSFACCPSSPASSSAGPVSSSRARLSSPTRSACSAETACETAGRASAEPAVASGRGRRRPPHETLLDYLRLRAVGAALVLADELPGLADHGPWRGGEARRRGSGGRQVRRRRSGPPTRNGWSVPAHEQPTSRSQRRLLPLTGAPPSPRGQGTTRPRPLGRRQGRATPILDPRHTGPGRRSPDSRLMTLWPRPRWWPRLASLTVAELEAVRRHESTTRRRRTVLHKIAQLSSEP